MAKQYAKQELLSLVLILIRLCTLTGCDPIYPTGKLKVERIEPLSHGSSVDVEIIYPNTGSKIVLGWKDQNIEIISGDGIIAISGLSITGLESGTAVIQVNATTSISDEARNSGNEDTVYSGQIEVKVE